MDKKIVYIDMDGVLVDLVKCVEDTYPHLLEMEMEIGDILDVHDQPFYSADPIEGAVDAFNQLCNDPRFDVYILSTAPWMNVQSLTAKRVWVEKHLGEAATKKLILSHRKDLMIGDYLIDDRPNNGAAEFNGEWIQFGTKQFESWKKVLKYLETNS